MHSLFAIPLVVAGLMMFGPIRGAPPPLIESDYCYQLIAADRMYQGLGLTSLQPIAPRQPWTWEFDFGFLTQWPAGYSFLVWLVRVLTGAETVSSCQWIGTVAGAIAIVFWFLWIKRSISSGFAGILLAAAGAGLSVPLTSLRDPSTDALLVALLPLVFLLVEDALPPTRVEGQPRTGTASGCLILAAGLLAGCLVWIRYAAVFVPAGLALGMWVIRMRNSRVSWRDIGLFVASAGLPIATLATVNRLFGPDLPLHTQLNLGSRTTWNWTWANVTEAWWRLADIPVSKLLGLNPTFIHTCFAILPLLLLGAGLTMPSARRTLLRWLDRPAMMLSAATLACLLLMLVSTTTLFGEKFNFVRLDRYYLPVKPVYVALFLGPVLWVKARMMRAIHFIPLLALVASNLPGEWRDRGDRAVSHDLEVTAYGRVANCFTPGADALFRWVASLDTEQTFVFSNFHDYLTLETGRVAYPLPQDETNLHAWVQRIAEARGIRDPRVLFILDGHNRWRSHWLPDLEELVSEFSLRRFTPVPEGISAVVFEWQRPDAREEPVANSSRVSCPIAVFPRTHRAITFKGILPSLLGRGSGGTMFTRVPLN